SNAELVRQQLQAVATRDLLVLIVDLSGTIDCDHACGETLGQAYQRAETAHRDLGPVGGDVGVEIALLDGDGVIVWVNHAWQAFAAANGGDPDRTGTGVSYLDVCAAAPDDPGSAQVDAAIRRALAGDL